MLIDWFTVIAQAVNFLILVWLLKRFLYKPILNALDAREKRIAAELADADAKKAEAATEREEYNRKNDEFDRQRAALLNKATNEAAAERRRLLDEVRKDADGLRAKLQDTLSSEYRNLHEEIARRTRAEVFAIARKTLTDLAGASLEERMVDVFVRRLHELDNEKKARLAAMLEPPDIPVLVRSAFDLAPARRASIEDAVKATLAAKTPVRFEIVPDLVGGIELIMQGQKVAWSIGDYLASLEKDVNELLKVQHKPE
ncbi:MAG: F0F1 ATP synthase subunit B [Gallionellaceae bacterium]